MKYFIAAISVIGIILILLFFPIKTESKNEYLRIHIRANSNSVYDQNIKYKVKDEVIETLIPFLSEVKTFDEAKKMVEQKFCLIEDVANKVLRENGFNYTSHAQIKNEYFPTRTYGDITLKEGNYDALILNLGEGKGNNWWCIVFPAFCFTKTQNSDNIEYISLIWEIIKHIT